MKIPQLFRHKKLPAATARRASAAAGMDFENIPEPNMKLSRALLIVLLLHVVAVSGIIAFNAIKTRESSFVPAAPANAENNYIVKKGDNPVTIAKKLKVSYDDLTALNHIEDPHKLQIGQKLLIPAKAAKTKTSKVDQ